MLLRTSLAAQFRVTTQTVLASRLLACSRAEVEREIERELNENPALESVPQASRAEYHRQPDWPDDPLDSLAHRESVREQLCQQARLLAPHGDLPLIRYLIDALDEHGFLRATDQQLALELGTSPDRIRGAIAHLHELEPAGIGARDLRECLLLQCRDLLERGVRCENALVMIEQGWDDLARGHASRLCRRTGLSQEAVEAALRFMRRNLYPYPLALVEEDVVESRLLARPDLIVRRDRDARTGFTVEIPAAYRGQLSVSHAFSLALQDGAAGDAPGAARAWTGEAVERARLFIGALDRRRAMLRRLGEYLVIEQAAFFEYGARRLKPLTRAQAAQALGCHESTMSRAVRDKVLQLPNGQLIALADLFDRSLAAKEAIRCLVDGAGERISDREIAERLQSEAIPISRRTVTKYRRELHIPALGRHPFSPSFVRPAAHRAESHRG